MIVDKASGFSIGFNAGFGNTWFTRLGVSGVPAILYGDLSNKTLAAPTFTGAIPDITANSGDADVITDLSTYFSGATSYSISPAVEAGWNFDTITGILTVDTDDAQTFGPYTVTGTNATGSDSSNAFSVIISAVSTEETIREITSGGGAKGWPTRQDYRNKRKQQDILDDDEEVMLLCQAALNEILSYLRR